MLNYSLYLKFISGEEKEVILENPHKLIPDQNRPHALTYVADGFLHNIPFSSLADFWFDPAKYNECAKMKATQVQLPTPDCDCSSCQAAKNKIKTIAKTLD